MENFNSILRELVCREYAAIPNCENEIAYEFSHDFRNKMNRMIRAQKRPIWNLSQSIPKKVAIVMLFLLLLLTTACGIPAVREAFEGFITELRNGGYEMEVEGAKTTHIEKILLPYYVPEGFTEFNKIVNEGAVILEYENEVGERIIYSQSPTCNNNIFWDAENAEISSVQINGHNTYISSLGDTQDALWLQDNYLITITCIGDIKYEVIVEMIKNVR